MDFIFNIAIFVIILSIIVIVHEFGHLIAAKKFGVYCSEFSIGMGPAIYKYKKEGSETTISIRALPLGGFVQMAGEEGAEIEGVPFERTINGIKAWKQVVVMAAGAIMNVLLAYVVFCGIVLYDGEVSVPSDPIIGEVSVGLPADTVGMQTNDKILKMILPDGTEIIPNNFDDLVDGMKSYTEGNVIYVIERNGGTIQFSVQPKYDESMKRYLVGFGAIPKTREIAWYESFYYGFEMLLETTVSIVQGFGNLLTGAGLKDVSGPVGIYQATSEVAQAGLYSLVLWLGLLSLNIGIFNLMPIPILDGGRIVIVVIEKIVGRKLNEKVQTGIMLVGLVLILCLMVFATANDILRLF